MNNSSGRIKGNMDIMENTFETITFEYDNGVALIALNRPERLNSFTQQMHNELKAVMQILQSRVDLRGVILTGTGRGFCAGQDLSERGPLPEGEVRDLSESLEKNYKPLIMAIRALPVPVVCFVNGVAAGAGFSLALACDILIAVKSASFLQAFSRIGLAPDAGSTYFLPRVIGTQRAMAASMLAKPISSAQAEQWGLVWQVIEDADLATEIENMKQTLKNGATRSYAAIKELIYASSSMSLEEQLNYETQMQKELGYTEDYREGTAAFAEKRPAVLKGR